MPAKVHTKLLIAFVGTSVLLVAVGLLGLRVLGQSNDRVGSLGALQERAVRATASSSSDAVHVRALLAQNAERDYYTVWPERPTDQGGMRCRRPDRSSDAADRIGAATAVDRLGFTPPAEDGRSSRSIRLKADQLSTLMQEIIHLDNGDASTAR